MTMNDRDLNNLSSYASGEVLPTPIHKLSALLVKVQLIAHVICKTTIDIIKKNRLMSKK